MNSVGSKGDSYDNALAETVNGLYKTELIRRRRSWRTTEEVEARDRRLGLLVEREPAPFRLRRYPSGRVRGGLPSRTRSNRSRLNQSSGVSTIPRAVQVRHRLRDWTRPSPIETWKVRSRSPRASEAKIPATQRRA